jgi:hypothetical protein
MQDMRGESDARRRIPLSGFGKDLFFWYFRQLPDDFLAEVVVREDPYSLRRQDGAQTIYGLLDERALT